MRLVKWTFLVLAMGSCLVLLLAMWVARPLWLTPLYEPQLRPAVANYLKVRYSVEGWTDTDAMAQVAAGKQLALMVEGRCASCSDVQFVLRVTIKTFQVLESGSNPKVRARVERAWRPIRPETGVIGYCHAMADDEIFTLAPDNGQWKVADVEHIAQTDWEQQYVNSPELLAEYCP